MKFQWFCRFRRSKLAPKIEQKSIKIWSPSWSASWHRFLMDFGEFWEPSWEGKSSQDRSKIDPKRHRKNDEKKMCLKASEASAGKPLGNVWTPRLLWSTHPGEFQTPRDPPVPPPGRLRGITGGFEAPNDHDAKMTTTTRNQKAKR